MKGRNPYDFKIKDECLYLSLKCLDLFKNYRSQRSQIRRHCFLMTQFRIYTVTLLWYFKSYWKVRLDDTDCTLILRGLIYIIIYLLVHFNSLYHILYFWYSIYLDKKFMQCIFSGHVWLYIFSFIQPDAKLQSIRIFLKNGFIGESLFENQ